MESTNNCVLLFVLLMMIQGKCGLSHVNSFCVEQFVRIAYLPCTENIALKATFPQISKDFRLR